MNKKLGFFFLITSWLILPMSAALAEPHTHAGRAHDHPLPAQGIGHKHNAGATGRATSGQAAAPTPPQPRSNSVAASNNRRPAPSNAGNPNNELQQAYKQKNYARVYQIASAYAQRGDPAGQYVMGQLFLLGQGQKESKNSIYMV